MKIRSCFISNSSSSSFLIVNKTKTPVSIKEIIMNLYEELHRELHPDRDATKMVAPGEHKVELSDHSGEDEFGGVECQVKDALGLFVAGSYVESDKFKIQILEDHH